MPRSPIVREELSSAGVPPWAPYSAKDLGTTRYYAWVGSSGEIEGALVGQMTRTGVEQLIHQCGVVRRGEQLRAPRQPPAHLEESTAVIVVHSHRCGHGSLSRSPQETRSLADLLDYAERELRQLRPPE